MSDALTFNGKKLLLIKEVVGRTKYTRDYVAKLAREGQIVGVQVGRQWYVDEDSLVRFAEVSELELSVRHRQLSQVRRRERDIKHELKKQWDLVVAQPSYSVGRAVTHSVALVLVGIITVYSAYLMPPLLVSYVASQTALTPLLAVEPGTRAVVVPPSDLTTTVLVDGYGVEATPVVFAATKAVTAMTDTTDGVLLLPVTTSASSALEIAALFSDPVTVQFAADTHTGTVELSAPTAVAAEKFRFVTVPVAAAADREASNSVTP